MAGLLVNVNLNRYYLIGLYKLLYPVIYLAQNNDEPINAYIFYWPQNNR